MVEDNYTQHVESSSQGIFWSLLHTWNECEPSDRIPVITMANYQFTA